MAKRSVGGLGTLFCVAVGAFLASPGICAGQTNEWTSDLNGSWLDPLNWSLGVPGAADDVVINRPLGQINLTLNSGAQSINSLVLWENLFIQGGASLEIATTATVRGQIELGGGGLVGGTWDFSNGGLLWLNTGGQNVLDGVTILGTGLSNRNNAAANLTIRNGLTVNGGGGVARGLWQIEDGSTAAFTGGGVLGVSGGSLQGGTWDVSSLGQGVRVFSNGGTLDGVSILGNMTLDSGGTTVVRNGLSLSGDATVGGKLTFEGSQTLSSGSFSLNSLTSAIEARSNVSVGTPVTLTLGPAVTVELIHGSSRLGSALTSAEQDTIVNQGEVIGWDGAITAKSFVNEGLVRVPSGRTLEIGSLDLSSSSATWTNSGTILVEANGLAQLGGAFSTSDIGTFDNAGRVNVRGALDNTGSTLTIDSEMGNWSFDGLSPASSAVLTGGSVVVDAGQRLTLGQSVVDGVSISGSVLIDGGDQNARALVTGGSSFAGDVEIKRELAFEGNTTLGGTAVFTLSNAGGEMFAFDSANNPVTLTLGSSQTVRGGAGNIGTTSSAFQDSVVNEGTIEADGSVSAGILRLGGRSFTNDGSLSVINNGQAVIGSWSSPVSADSWTNTGSISVEAGSSLYLGSTFSAADLGSISNSGEAWIIGNFDNTGHTLALDASSGDWGVGSASGLGLTFPSSLQPTITGGSITTSDGRVFRIGGATFDGVSIAGDIQIEALTTADLQGGSTFTGNADVYGTLAYEGSTTISSGTFSLLNPNASLRTYDGTEPPGPTTLTIGPGAAIDGFAGVIGINSATRVHHIVNHADVHVDGSLGSGSMVMAGDSATNSGDITIVNGGRFEFATDTWSNTGTISVGTGSSLTLGGAIDTASFGTITNSGTVELRGTLDNTGNTFTVTAPMGKWAVWGTVIGGTIEAPATPVTLRSASQRWLDGVTLDGAFDGGATVRNGLDMTAGSTWDISERISFDRGTQVVTGGTLTLAPGSPTMTVMEVDTNELGNPSNVTLSPSTAVEGYGIVKVAGGDLLVNQGTISADSALGHSLRIQTTNDGQIGFRNEGLLEATNGGSLAIEFGRWQNSGSIVAEAGSSVQLSGTYSMPGGTIAANGGTVELRGVLDNDGVVGSVAITTNGVTLLNGDIRNATVDISAGRTLAITGNSDFRNVTATGAMTLASGKLLVVEQGLDLTGTLTALGNDTAVFFSGTQSFENGTILFPDNGGAAHQISSSFGSTVTLDAESLVKGGDFFLGEKRIGTGGTRGNSFVNEGTILSDVLGSRVDLIADNLVNNGVIRVENGSTLNIAGRLSDEVSSFTSPRTWSGSGSIEVDHATLMLGGSFLSSAVQNVSNNGGTILLSGRMDNTSSTFTLDGAGSSWIAEDGFLLSGQPTGATIVGGTVEFLNGGQLLVASSEGLNLQNALVNGDWTIQGIVRALDGTQLDGVVTLDGPNAKVQFQNTSGGTSSSVTSGTFVFDAPGAQLPLVPSIASDSLSLGSGVTVRGGTGQITRAGSGRSVVSNAGLISSDLIGESIRVTGSVTNSGTMEAINGGRLVIGGASLDSDSVLVNTGTLRAIGSTLEINGAFSTQDLGTLDLSGAAVEIGALVNNSTAVLTLDGSVADWTFDGAAIIGGTVQTTNGAELKFIAPSVGSPSRLTGVELIGDARVEAGAKLEVWEFLDLVGAIGLTGSGAELVFVGDQTLGSGEIVFNPSSGGSDRVLRGFGSNYVTLGAGVTVRGGRGLIVTGGDVNRPESTILNEGLISADISGETITIDTTRFLNSGTIEAINGGEIDYSPPLALARSGAGSFSNHGVIEISAESAMKIDGQFFQSATGTLRIAIDDLDGMPLTGLLRGDSAEFDGLLEVIAPTPFEPANGQAFRVLSFGAVSGAFASVTLPGLPDGWWWVTESLYNDGYIRAVPACGPISLALVCIGAASARRKR